MKHFIVYKLSVSNISLSLHKIFSSAVLMEYNPLVDAQFKPRSFVPQVPCHVWQFGEFTDHRSNIAENRAIRRTGVSYPGEDVIRLYVLPPKVWWVSMGREDRLPWRPQRTDLTNGRNYRETDLDPHKTFLSSQSSLKMEQTASRQRLENYLLGMHREEVWGWWLQRS